MWHCLATLQRLQHDLDGRHEALFQPLVALAVGPVVDAATMALLVIRPLAREESVKEPRHGLTDDWTRRGHVVELKERVALFFLDSTS